MLGLDDVDDRESIGIDDHDPAIREDEEAVAFILRNDLHNARRQPFQPDLLRDFRSDGNREVDFLHRSNVNLLHHRSNSVCCSTEMLTLILVFVWLSVLVLLVVSDELLCVVVVF